VIELVRIVLVLDGGPAHHLPHHQVGTEAGRRSDALLDAAGRCRPTPASVLE
jgi:hypothetical protein